MKGLPAVALTLLCSAAQAETRLKRDWFITYDSKGYTGVEAHAVALGPSGSLLTGGVCGHPGTLPDHYVESRKPSGGLIWVYRGYPDNNQVPGQVTRGLAADPFGNLYGAGTLTTIDEGLDLFIEKLDSAGGTVLWTRKVDGPVHGNDQGYGVAVDSSGFAYAAGAVQSMGRGMDAWIGKYDGAGNRLWSRVIDGGSGGDDAAYGVCVDTYGRVYAVGSLSVSGQGGQIWVAKFDKDGNLLAQDTYGGIGDDRATGCSAGAGDTLFVSGAVMDPASPPIQPVRTHSWLRAYSVKGASELKELSTVVDEINWGWANAAAAAQLATGLQAVYTVGAATREITGTDIQVTRWIFDRATSGWKNKREAFYDGPTHLNDEGFSAAVDALGNLYAAGYETVTDAEGTPAKVAWTRSYDPWLLKENLEEYFSKGAGDGPDSFNRLYLDSYNELLYVGGTLWSRNNSWDAMIHVLDSGSGNRLDFWWSDMPGNEHLVTMIPDASGNFYMGGSLSNRLWKLGRQHDGKFGSLAWYSSYNPYPGTVGGAVQDAALMPDGTLVTAGGTTKPGTLSDIHVVKWNIHSCDSAPPGSSCRPDIVWEDFVSYPQENSDSAQGIAADGLGNAFVIGKIAHPSQSGNIWLARYDPSGNKAWTREVDGPAGGNDVGQAIAFNPANGKLYAAGYVAAPGQSNNYWLAQLDKDGNILWQAQWNGPFNSNDALSCMAFDSDGNVFLAGQSYAQDSSGAWDYRIGIAKFSPEGTLLGSFIGDIPGLERLSVESIQVDNRGRIFVCGSGISPEKTNTDAWAARFSIEAVVPAPAPPPGPPCDFFVFPNPFDPKLKAATLHWELPEDAAVHMSLFDQLGKPVASWDFAAGSAGGRKGANETVWNGAGPSGRKVSQGMYYLKWSADPIDCKKTARIGVKR